ncbi:MAG TPA: type II secretion system protein GspM [Geminicoccus sp.]|uniref:type II secretion system protein GspM n=1 Tax=Geminicoccus sp. TaxID=2024832 RepID=UPI002BA03B1C|nr:type II secretion system protein GspM [Geminicoccus sp.]HWL70898.1 type II secretion system protein GspM [Geminicoccus sp.]
MTGLVATPAASRAAAVAILLALLGLAAAMILVPLWLIDRQHEELATIDQRVRAIHAGLANQAQQAGSEAVPDVQGTIEAQSPSLAGGIIQELTGNAVVVSGGELRSVELLPTREEERFVAVPIRVTFTGDSVMLREFLYRIETSSPVLLVERLDITAEQSPDDPSNVWQGDIQVAAEIVGWMRQPEPQS